MLYFFDTNIVLHYLRESSLAQTVENQLHPFDSKNVASFLLSRLANFMLLRTEINGAKNELKT